MALKILESCINCDMCEPECPNSAIFMGAKVYEINPDLCTECIGHYDKPTCERVCPIGCIEKDSDREESLDQLAEKFVAITGYEPKLS